MTFNDNICSCTLLYNEMVQLTFVNLRGTQKAHLDYASETKQRSGESINRWAFSKISSRLNFIMRNDYRADFGEFSPVLVVQRRPNGTRFLCKKCGFVFWGSKKTVKQHMRPLQRPAHAASLAEKLEEGEGGGEGGGGESLSDKVTECKVDETAEEKIVFDAMLDVKKPKADPDCSRSPSPSVPPTPESLSTGRARGRGRGRGARGGARGGGGSPVVANGGVACEGKDSDTTVSASAEALEGAGTGTKRTLEQALGSDAQRQQHLSATSAYQSALTTIESCLAAQVLTTAQAEQERAVAVADFQKAKEESGIPLASG